MNVKKIISQILIIVSLSSCSSDNPKILSLDVNTIEMYVNSAESIEIKGVNPRMCIATSNDEFAIRANINGESLFIESFYVGYSDIKVKYENQEAIIKVNAIPYDESDYIKGIVYDFGVSKEKLDELVDNSYSSRTENISANSVDYKYERGTNIVIDRYFFNGNGMFAVKKELYSILPDSYPTGTGNETHVSVALRNYGIIKDSSIKYINDDDYENSYKLKYELYEHTGKYYIYREEITQRKDGKNTFSIYYTPQAKDAINHTFDK